VKTLLWGALASLVVAVALLVAGATSARALRIVLLVVAVFGAATIAAFSGLQVVYCAWVATVPTSVTIHAAARWLTLAWMIMGSSSLAMIVIAILTRRK
jgi:hypothetical protein